MNHGVAVLSNSGLIISDVSGVAVFVLLLFLSTRNPGSTELELWS